MVTIGLKFPGNIYYTVEAHVRLPLGETPAGKVTPLAHISMQILSFTCNAQDVHVTSCFTSAPQNCS